MPAPEPKGTIDSLALLTQKFGRRAGDMKVTEFFLCCMLAMFLLVFMQTSGDPKKPVN